MNDCIFCKIIKGEIKSYTIYEDDIVKVFLDANPDDNGHMLIVPKKHITDFTELDSNTAAHIHEVAKKMKDLIYDKLKPQGLTLVNNYGIKQYVKHYHLHIIPSYNPKEGLIPIEDTYNKLMH